MECPEPETQADQQPRSAAQPPTPAAFAPLPYQTARNIAFRWIFCYFVMYFLPHPQSAWLPAMSQLGQNVFHIGHPLEFKFTGSGDTTYHYLVLMSNLVLASIAAAVWSLVDRRRANYQKLEQWLKLVLRCSLGNTMLQYGASKVFEGQFPQPGPGRLVETFGEASPMGLLWTFMGASRTYSIFGGLAEVVPGLLLFFPPVAGLGALLCSAVMFHIFMLNMCYDVPVKIYSFQLLLTSIYLALPQIKRLFGFLVFNRRIEPLPVVPLFKRETANEVALALQVLVGVVLAGYSLKGASAREKYEIKNRPPMYGVWQVDECVLPEKPPAIKVVGEVPSPWQRLIFEYPGTVVIYLADGRRRYYAVNIESAEHKIILSSMRDAAWQRVFSMVDLSPNVVTLDGTADGVPAHMKLHKIDETKFPLMGRGFHWINEYPYNH
jgi:hypothetical protein